MKDELLYSLIANGHYHTNHKEVFKFLEPIIPSIKWLQDEEINHKCAEPSSDINEALNKTAEILYKKYLSYIDQSAKVGYTFIWNGTEDSVCKWHNDLKEGPNICFLLYLTDVSEQCGGKIEIRKKDTKKVTGSITPKKYDIVMFSQESDWEHRVSPFLCGPMERITINIGFCVKWI